MNTTTRDWHQYQPFAIRGIIRSGILTRSEACDLMHTIYADKRGGLFCDLTADVELMTELAEQTR